MEEKKDYSKHRLNVLPSNLESQEEGKVVGLGRFPSWLHRKIPSGGNLFKTDALLRKYKLNTVCEEAKCPNRMECYAQKTATFLVLGKACTRNCGFCDIDFDKQPKAPEFDEPERVAASVSELGLKHVVITMVARDDLPDGGALHLARIIQKTREKNLGVTIEVLTSDFEGKKEALDLVLQESPDVFNHNVETVRELSPRVRHKASYDRSLDVLSYVRRASDRLFVKSGLMVGLGETEEQVFQAIRDLYEVGCDIITIGQYLQANRKKLLVKSFIPPEQFKRYERYGVDIGIKQMYCGPFVRSSYHAAEVQMAVRRK